MSDDPKSRSGKECFVVCPIGPAGSDIRKRSDQVYRHIISPVVEEFGYSPQRGDLIEQSGQITTQLIDKLLNADLVVADLTDQNPNVFYELAIRHAVRKPFVHLMAHGQIVPFDIRGFRTILVNHRDLDSVFEAKEQLKGMLRTIESGAPVETPVTYTIDLQQLRHSENSEARGIADIMEEMRAIKKYVQPTRRRPNMDLITLRRFVERLGEAGRLQWADRDFLVTSETTKAHDEWVDKAMIGADPWGAAPPPSGGAFADDEPPF
ncbi:hypothetical protein M8542_21000 [Amycolatopsis sp. OK19-0408]|uniref:Uncharacterized protein n=1 Tax=Amycolatopsis iheyensis TaxID=2945988 RepID=A0A9X2NCS5_9PSEU|nr:hypothetical protein [Amycolatopsis iheyensis]MCR6485308.1 hypothetical protein [Amycolatopsis iheyensis]